MELNLYKRKNLAPECIPIKTIIDHRIKCFGWKMTKWTQVRILVIYVVKEGVLAKNLCFMAYWNHLSAESFCDFGTIVVDISKFQLSLQTFWDWKQQKGLLF